MKKTNLIHLAELFSKGYKCIIPSVLHKEGHYVYYFSEWDGLIDEDWVDYRYFKKIIQKAKRLK